MKTLLAVALGALLFISGCCDSIKCLPEAEIAITLQKFNAGEVDSVIVKHYLRNTGFGVLIDSFSTQGRVNVVNDDTVYIISRFNKYAYYLSDDSLNISSDLQVEVPAIARTYRVTDLDYKAYVCKQCGGKKAYEHRLSNYTVNDSAVQMWKIVINR